MAHKGFDFRTQRLNKKGQIVSKTPYRMFVENGIKKLERPPGSGQFFTESGEPIVKSGKKSKAKVEEPAVEFSGEGDIDLDELENING